MNIDFSNIVDAEYECRKAKLGEEDERTVMGPGGFGLTEPDILNLAYAIIACVLAKLGVPGDGAGALSAGYASEAAGGSLEEFDGGLIDWIVRILQGLGHVVVGADKEAG